MKLTVTRNYISPGLIGLSHSGVHLKREHGGPPWWKHVNGIHVRLPDRRTVWIELFKACRSGPFYKDITKRRSGA